MEAIFNYETMKHTLVLTAYLMLLIFDCYWIGYLIISFVKWFIKKIKSLFTKKGNVEETKEKTANE